MSEARPTPSGALSIYAEFRPDLILLDLHMPKLDGFAVMSELNLQIDSDDYLPILVLTADVNPDAKQRALSLGAKDFLTKALRPRGGAPAHQEPPGGTVPSRPAANP